ncbi:hypothetical protein BUALT_Bualt15G0029400 [Buddleja alternifolia]|uniref:DUF547 domain-containing protein n=1 Tax=Buddleja alternifolia TaxID=168488 RepID=A0AAV6WHG6_9LAMI|nr:hypothetical protein BUALT_Bualt15G0029400 [Buddleja alternifolia]
MGYLKKFEPKRQLSPGEAQTLLKDEIIELEKELEGQTMVRSALQKAMNCQPLTDDPTYKALSKPDENLIKEIAALELEIMYLEKCLLSMYRKNFAKRPSILAGKPKTNSGTHNWMSLGVAKVNLASNEDSISVAPIICKEAETVVDSGIYRSHSSLSQHSVCSFGTSSRFEAVTEALDSYHSLPLSMLEQRKQDSASNASLGQYLGCSFPDRVCETPNWLSEEMIKCISTVYCHISDPPPFVNHDFSFTSHLSTPSELSNDPLLEENSLFDPWSSNPFHNEASKEFDGSLFTIVEVKNILRDSESLNSVQDLLQNYRSLISRLAQVDPRKLKLEEKLSFWINVHNALVMHAFLVYGIPRGNVKRNSLVLKAAYNIGGHTISVDTIQSSILGCRLPRPTQWLHSLFFPKTKFKSRDPRKAYAINHPEPRLYFALCSGCQSDPVVRLYTPKKVFQDLEMAKEEHIQMNIKLHKEQKLLVPKNVEVFIKEMGLSSSGIQEMLEHSMPDSLRKYSQQRKLQKKVDWIPHNFAFRFLLSNELVA